MKPTQTSALPQSLALQPLARFLLVCAAFVLAAAFFHQFFYPVLWADQSSYLFEAQRLLDGNQVYGPHLSETNPPLIIWFSTIPVRLARWMHTSPVLLLRLLFIAMILASTAWCVAILRRSPAFTNRLSLSLIGVAIAIAESSTGVNGFTQREHLLLILLLPYLLAAATGIVDRLSLAERCALGIAAGLAIWFKPHQVLIVIALEVLLALRTRSLRRALKPEFLSLIFTCLLVFALIYICTPLYLQQTYPILLDTYWALGTSSAFALIVTYFHYPVAVFALLLLWFVLRKSLHDPWTSLTLLVGGVAAAIASDLQHTTWLYHMIPARALFLIAAAYLLIDRLHIPLARFASDARLVGAATLTGSVIAAVLLAVTALRPHLVFPEPQVASEVPSIRAYFTQLEPSTTVYVFSTSVSALSEAYNHDLNWGSRFVHLWMLPAIIQNELGPAPPPAPFKRLSPQRRDQLASILRADSAEDLNFYHPSIVLVQHCTVERSCQGLDRKNFDMISWFRQNPDFAAAWSRYQKQQPGLDNYDVYKLVSGSAGTIDAK